jgi:hypothetical protein
MRLGIPYVEWARSHYLNICVGGWKGRKRTSRIDARISFLRALGRMVDFLTKMDTSTVNYWNKFAAESQVIEIHAEYLTDVVGDKKAVVVPLDEWQCIPGGSGRT